MILFHHPLCPHSRFVRLVLSEFGIEAELREERVWERRREFLSLDPMGKTPILKDETVGLIPDATIIAEYLDETRGLAFGDRRLLPDKIQMRIEVRRLMVWFHQKFFEEVTSPLVYEKIYKRYMTSQQGGGAPDMALIRAAKSNIKYHVKYISWLMREQNWLAGDTMTLADLAAAAHLSCVDFLGDVPWDEEENTKNWYARIKSRPSFRAILGDKLPGVTAPQHYADLDF